MSVPPLTQIQDVELKAAPVSSQVLFPVLVSVVQCGSAAGSLLHHHAMCLDFTLVLCPVLGELLLKWLPSPQHLDRCMTVFLAYES